MPVALKGVDLSMEEKEEKREKLVRTVQTGLWVALILVQMAVVNCLSVRAETGQSGAVEGAGPRRVSKDVVFEAVEGAAALPEELDIQVREGKETVTVACPMAEKEILKERWSDDFSFPITFHAYGSEYYGLGECRVPYNEERPELDGCEGLLLEMIGVSPEEYQITGLKWAGDAYRDGGGELCRDALGTGRKLVRDYRVRYVGEAKVPVRPWQQDGTGELEPSGTGDEAESGEGPGQEVLIGAGPEKKLQAEEATDPTLWQKITRTLLIIIGIGALLFFGGLLALALLWVVKKLRKWYTGRKRGGPRGPDGVSRA